MKPGNAKEGFDRLGFGGSRTLFVHEWNVVGRDDSRDVADHDACNAFNRLLSLIIYPRNDHRALKSWRPPTP
jgi:hypothetical protein